MFNTRREAPKHDSIEINARWKSHRYVAQVWVSPRRYERGEKERRLVLTKGT